MHDHHIYIIMYPPSVYEIHMYSTKFIEMIHDVCWMSPLSGSPFYSLLQASFIVFSS